MPTDPQSIINTGLITEDQLKKVCASLKPDRISKFVALFNSICPTYGIISKDIFHEFLANICEESGEFKVYEENLNYSAQRMTVVWAKRFPTVESAMPYAHNARSLAMKVYGNRKDLGNISDEDGFTFRGSGIIQMTGRSNFVNFGKWMESKFGIVNSPENWAELVRTSDEYSLHSACWIFSIAKKLNDEAERDEMKEIVKKINGGYTGYAERLRYYELAKKYVI